jgi:hypothetical protein
MLDNLFIKKGKDLKRKKTILLKGIGIVGVN